MYPTEGNTLGNTQVSLQNVKHNVCLKLKGCERGKLGFAITPVLKTGFRLSIPEKRLFDSGVEKPIKIVSNFGLRL